MAVGNGGGWGVRLERVKDRCGRSVLVLYVDPVYYMQYLLSMPEVFVVDSYFRVDGVDDRVNDHELARIYGPDPTRMRIVIEEIA